MDVHHCEENKRLLRSAVGECHVAAEPQTAARRSFGIRADASSWRARVREAGQAKRNEAESCSPTGTRVGHGDWQVAQGGEINHFIQDIRPKWRIDDFSIFVFNDDLLDI
jgi:hypothetical protein